MFAWIELGSIEGYSQLMMTTDSGAQLIALTLLPDLYLFTMFDQLADLATADIDVRRSWVEYELYVRLGLVFFVHEQLMEQVRVLSDRKK